MSATSEMSEKSYPPGGQKRGGKKTLRISLAKSQDVIDSLVGSTAREGPLAPLEHEVQERYRGHFTVELTEAEYGRTDIVLQRIERHAPVDSLSWRRDRREQEIVGPESIPLWNQPADVVFLSLQPDIDRALWRHRASDTLVWPTTSPETWPAEHRDGFLHAFAQEGFLSVEQYQNNMTRLIRTVKNHLDAHVLVYNCCSIDPNDRPTCYHGRKEPWSLRVQRFNLALMELSLWEGISIIDVERVLGELGAQWHVQSRGRYSQEGNKAICREVLRVLEYIGFFEERPLIAQMGKRRG